MILLNVFANKIVLSVTIAVFSAQILKTLIDYVKEGHFHWQSLFRGAGMPSSHTATVSALTLSVLLSEGFGTFFIITFFFSAIVIRDVIGDKVFAIHQERMINKLFQQMLKHEKVEWHNLIGHTFTEVFAGLFLGLLVTVIVFFK